jgi:SAM-dependent methyltransferase/uncharacterized protein YbaR (Trm112 family)
VRREHFESLRPVCPLCRVATLAVTHVAREADDDLLEGILGCTSPDCQREYPIVDGIPVIVAAIRGWLAANPLQVLQRDDLSPSLESLFGDVLGPGSPYDTLRHQVGIYAANHYESDSATQFIDRAINLSGRRALSPAVLPVAPAIDIGCSVGGTTFAFAERVGRLTVGVDLNFAMLRVASRALREGHVRYARRSVGLVHERREVTIELPARDLVDFWCCDAAALPFADGTFSTASALNIIDCVAAPQDVVAECARVLQHGGEAFVSTPYDWTPTATPVEQWLGGHSQRGPDRGAAEPALRALLSRHFEIVAEEENVPWRLRLHDRSAIDYLVHLIIARRP